MKLKLCSLSLLLVFGLCIGIAKTETSYDTKSTVQKYTHGVGG